MYTLRDWLTRVRLYFLQHSWVKPSSSTDVLDRYLMMVPAASWARIHQAHLIWIVKLKTDHDMACKAMMAQWPLIGGKDFKLFLEALGDLSLPPCNISLYSELMKTGWRLNDPTRNVWIVSPRRLDPIEREQIMHRFHSGGHVMLLEPAGNNVLQARINFGSSRPITKFLAADAEAARKFFYELQG